MEKYKKVCLNDVPVYSPPGHGDTFNRRLIGPKDGARHVEVIYGEMGGVGHAEAHAHTEFEQCMYMLSGKLRVTGDGEEVTLEKGEFIIFPVGCGHKVVCESEKASFIVIYAPPREASGEAVNKG